jgi:hypothetical protein
MTPGQLDVIVVNLDSSGDGLVSMAELVDQAVGCRLNCVREKLLSSVLAHAVPGAPTSGPEFARAVRALPGRSSGLGVP